MSRALKLLIVALLVGLVVTLHWSSVPRGAEVVLIIGVLLALIGLADIPSER